MPAPNYNVPAPDDRSTITCLYCRKQQDVSRKAISVTCKFCHKPLKLQDIAFKGYDARTAIETLGVVTIEKKGNVVSSRILCGGAVVRGKVKGAITSTGPVLVGPEAEIKGNVTAPTLAVGAGAILEGYYEIGKLDKPPETPPAS